MADEEEAKKPEEGAEGDAAAPAKSGGGLLSPKNIGILVALIGVMGGGAFFGLKMISGPEKGEGEVDKPEVVEKKLPGKIYDFESMVVNISGTQGTRYLKVTVSLELDDSAELSKEIDSRKAQFLDIMTTEFSSVTLDQVDDPASKNSLKFRLRQNFNDKLLSGEVVNIYFRDFVIQ
jgi:flagellar FliL protein